MQYVIATLGKVKLPLYHFDGVNYCETTTLQALLKLPKQQLDDLLKDLDIKTVPAGQFMDKHKELATLERVTSSTSLVIEDDAIEALITSREMLDLMMSKEDQEKIQRKVIEELGAVPTIASDGQVGYTTKEVARVLGVTEEEVEEIAVREGMLPKVPKGRN